MQVIIAGAGKLATELLASHELNDNYHTISWADRKETNSASIVVHAGSGRELPAVIAYCRSTKSTLIELSTGSDVEVEPFDFPVVLCANTNILMLKFMSMLETSGHLFRGYKVRLVESHQAAKTSVPGTALNIAQSIGQTANSIVSVRDPKIQCRELKIPDDQLTRHAFHQIRIEDGGSSLLLESRVYGTSPYADGVSRIIEVVCHNGLEHRLYSVMELVKNGWL
ncbi:dihydrodipicolinate reductase C-terminal domain-containing protein [Paraburkholderia nemoris]|uniref:4-hydroxy-tetrahydrodipicolinate reductase n=1 Tax=Paraburkholderia nemoris TaxID=2793076 RepID=A0ABN7KZL9_9BURK|nr:MULTISPECIES: dihydrodipicolinate reductase C-terminal domain-containing protein [Paraburkholderia]MBK3810059.1 dihydrodipicolinate reductase [Paraburkholderia aspalathi]CAE6722801.1 4-hydroxy-tetrahydrodipicolinate reductase [Paraburkholderia nemoris]CAE6750310.1 4-hydroxy-tetrahydrodipicolinate reductase [Paraburkholderia nemoris]